MNAQNIRESHKVVAEHKFAPAKIEKGYANQTMYINLTDLSFAIKPVSRDMKEKFIGGRGFGLKLLWDGVTGETKWNDPENEIIIAPGPIAGITQYPGSGKSYVVSISPLTGAPYDSNVGGYFGPLFKFAGFDALEIQGKAAREVVVFIDGVNGTVSIEEAPLDPVDSHILAEELTKAYAENEEDRVNVSVVSAGTAADHSLIGMLNFSFYDKSRKAVRLKQAGRGGIGTVLRDKKVKALVIRGPQVKGDLNHPADKAVLDAMGLKLHREMANLDNVQNKMRIGGTNYLTKITNQYDILPNYNFKFGSDPQVKNITADAFIPYFNLSGHDGCWHGCSMACAKVINAYELKTGPYRGHKVLVDGPEYETVGGVGSACAIYDPDYVIENNFYCDTYGVDTISFGTLTAFVMECYEAGVLNKEITGGLELNFGNKAAAMELLHQMARGEGFGVIAGLGVRRMKKYFVENYQADAGFLEDIGMEAKGLEFSEYVSKESLAQQGGYGLTNKGPQHDEAWLIFTDMVNKQIPTFEDKAEALHYYPMFRTWFSLVGLCKLPWNDIVPADNRTRPEPAKVPEHVENYLELFYGVTGQKIDLKEMLLQAERVYNFQRVFNLKMGYGTREHDKIPYRAVGPVTAAEYEFELKKDKYDKELQELVGVDIQGKTTEEKIALLRAYREDQYQKLIDAVYKRRGWNNNGVPKPETLQRLGIDYPEVVSVVEHD